MSFIGAHHAYRRDLHTHKTHWRSRVIMMVDKSVYVIGLTSVIVNVPQLWNIWMLHDTSGVSFVSWVGFLIASFFWLGYGFLHRERPIVVVNGCLIVIQAGIVIGLLIKP